MRTRSLSFVFLLLILMPRGSVAQDPLLVEDAPQSEAVAPLDAGTVSAVCGTASGTRFNLEPRPFARAQHTTSIDFLRNRVAAGVDLVIGTARDTRSPASPAVGPIGYYVSRNSTCAPEFEGSLAEGMEGRGLHRNAAIVAVDPRRDAVFIVAEVPRGFWT